MRINNLMTYAIASFIACGVTACSSSNDDPGNGDSDKTAYVFGKDGGHTSCDHVLFNEDGKETPTGNFIGNGEQNFVFNGTQTIKKGTYIPIL